MSESTPIATASLLGWRTPRPSTASCTLTPSQPLGPGTVSAAFAGDDAFLASTTTADTLIFEYTTGGAFVVGDKSADLQSSGKSVTFWSDSWATDNQLSRGSAPDSFKGFADSASPPVCGKTWTTHPGPDESPRVPSSHKRVAGDRGGSDDIERVNAEGHRFFAHGDAHRLICLMEPA